MRTWGADIDLHPSWVALKQVSRKCLGVGSLFEGNLNKQARGNGENKSGNEKKLIKRYIF